MKEPGEKPAAKIVRVIGKVDAATAPDLEKLRALHAAGEKEIVIALADATYISSGLRVLLLNHKRQASNGQMILRNTAPKIMWIMRMCGVGRVFCFTQHPY